MSDSGIKEPRARQQVIEDQAVLRVRFQEACAAEQAAGNKRREISAQLVALNEELFEITEEEIVKAACALSS